MNDPKLRVLDLFSGIGGFSRGLEATGGFETAAFCEMEPWPCRILEKHWPGTPIYNDVRELTSERLEADGIGRIDVIAGGFPCTDISVAGKGAGIEGEHSGLWSEIARLTGELRPRYVLLENVAALLGRGLGTVLGDLAEIGYNAEWHCIPAASAGASHRRDRIWVVAYPSGSGARLEKYNRSGQERERAHTPKPAVLREGNGETGAARATANGQDVPDPVRERQQGQGQPLNTSDQKANRERETGDAVHVGERGIRQPQSGMGLLAHGISAGLSRSRWIPEPGIGRVAQRIPDRTKKLKALGNSLCPIIPEIIGRCILEQLGEQE